MLKLYISINQNSFFKVHPTIPWDFYSRFTLTILHSHLSNDDSWYYLKQFDKFKRFKYKNPIMWLIYISLSIRTLFLNSIQQFCDIFTVVALSQFCIHICQMVFRDNIWTQFDKFKLSKFENPIMRLIYISQSIRILFLRSIQQFRDILHSL